MLAVGDSTRLEIIFNSSKYTRTISKRPKIETNEGPPDKSVMISCNVTDRPDSTYPVVIQPYKLDLSQFSEKVIKEKDFIVSNVSDKDVELRLVCAPDGLVEIKLPDSIKPGKSGKGELRLQKEAYGESFEKSFTFEVITTTNDEEQLTRFTVPVKRSIKLSETQAVSRRDPQPKDSSGSGDK